jgi:3-deoxy-D-manno-octulosonic-acid transferase
MSVLFYALLTRLYFTAIHLLSPLSARARRWVQGRKELFAKLEQAFSVQPRHGAQWVWMHCASLGEFEQGRPVLEQLKAAKPELKVLLTFFSPSGYEQRKDYPLADMICYLPADTAANAARFVQLTRPALAIFVKYEFWYFHLRALHRAGIPLVLIAAAFRQEQPFFHRFGGLHRRMLHFFKTIFVQDDASVALLKGVQVANVNNVGDPRADRVLQVAAEDWQHPLLAAFCGTSKVVVCGSTWPADESMLLEVLAEPDFKDWKIVLAPHDADRLRLQRLADGAPIPAALLSSLSRSEGKQALNGLRLLVVDTVGMLSRLYRYGHLAYVGGGFGRGIHNLLEPAVYGLPVLFGPRHHAFVEAGALIRSGGGFALENTGQLRDVFLRLAQEDARIHAGHLAAQVVRERSGATHAICSHLLEILSPHGSGAGQSSAPLP